MRERYDMDFRSEMKRKKISFTVEEVFTLGEETIQEMMTTARLVLYRRTFLQNNIGWKKRPRILSKLGTKRLNERTSAVVEIIKEFGWEPTAPEFVSDVLGLILGDIDSDLVKSMMHKYILPFLVDKDENSPFKFSTFLNPVMDLIASALCYRALADCFEYRVFNIIYNKLPEFSIPTVNIIVQFSNRADLDSLLELDRKARFEEYRSFLKSTSLEKAGIQI